MHPPDRGLNRSEVRIAKLLAAGLSDPEIALRTGLGEAAVATCLAGLQLKLGLRDRTEIADWAVQHGVVDPEQG